MYNGYYFTKLRIKERQRQFEAEADRRRLRKAAATEKKEIGTVFRQKQRPAACECTCG